MNIIIFSKDRSCQLDLFLRSMKFYFDEWYNHKINIIYTYSNKEYSKGYDIIQKEHYDINFIKEKNFKKDLLTLINKDEEHTVFFVDDNIFKESFSIYDEQFKILKNNKKILCLSLRLHPNLNYCYPARFKMNKPTLLTDNIFNWNILKINEYGDYSYPMSLDGHIFKTTDILPLLIRLNYNNPNSLESILSMNPIKKPYMFMYDKSIIMNNPINKVQNWNNNIHGNISSKELNDSYLKGKRISLETFKGFENTSCHQEIDIIFE